MTGSEFVVPLISAVAAILGYLITARVGKSGSREVALINELQEELVQERNERKKLEIRVDDLFTKVQILATYNTLWEIHSTQLEAQIIAGGGIPLARPPQLIRNITEVKKLD